MRKLKLEELQRASIEAYKIQKKFPIVVVLDNVRSGHNVGAALRTADAFNVECVWMYGITPCPPHREILKSGIGASKAVSWSQITNLHQSIEMKRAEGYKVIGIEQTTTSVMANNVPFSFNDAVVLIFGNEVNGVSQDLLDICDLCLEIPQFGTKHSLNVSVSIGVVLWEWMRFLANRDSTK